VADLCARRGLLVSPGEEWFPAEPAGPFLRLNYSGPDEPRFEEATRILAAAIEELAGTT
jgi:DNA-binding transcriptional MocR family regulator